MQSNIYFFHLKKIEYYEVVSDSLRKYDEQCRNDVKSAIDTVELLLSHNYGAKVLQRSFK